MYIDLTSVLVFIILVLVAILLYRSVRNGGAAAIGGAITGVVGGAISSLRGKKRVVKRRRGGADDDDEPTADYSPYNQAATTSSSSGLSGTSSSESSSSESESDKSDVEEVSEVTVEETPVDTSGDYVETVEESDVIEETEGGRRVNLNQRGAYSKYMDKQYNNLHHGGIFGGGVVGGLLGTNWKLYVSEPHFTNLKNGKKDVELRVNKPVFAKYAEKGKLIDVVLSPRPAESQKDESFTVKVTDFETFKTFSEALDKKTLARVAPGLTKAEATQLSRKYILEDMEKQYGIVALSLQRVDALGKTMKAKKMSHRVTRRRKY